MARTSPLDSPTIGTAVRDAIRACPTPGPRPSDPGAPSQGEAVALALSGGGFRATLAALGVIRLLADVGLLRRVKYMSSVSGGSIAGGAFAAAYSKLHPEDYGTDSLDDHVIRPVMKAISERSLKWRLIRNAWRTIGPPTRTDLLANVFDNWWFGGLELSDLSRQCRWIFNGASMTSGVRFGFERDVVGDWVLGRVSTDGTGIRLAQAVATSCAVPGAFAPFVLKNVRLPCQTTSTVKLLDGGAYDNLGLEPLDNLKKTCLVALNAGGQFYTGRYGWVPLARDLKRASALLYRQSISLRMRVMVERFKAWEQARENGSDPPSWARQGVLFGLATTIEPAEEWLEGRPEHSEWREALARVPTSFDRFDRELCRRLIYRGWWLAGASLATYHRSLLPERLPMWRDP